MSKIYSILFLAFFFTLFAACDNSNSNQQLGDEDADTSDTLQTAHEDEHAMHGMYDDAMALYEEGKYLESGDAFADIAKVEGVNANPAYNAACAYSLAGETDKAIEFAEEAYSKGMLSFETDSDFDNIKDEPEFIAIVNKAKADLEEFGSNIEPTLIMPTGYNLENPSPLVVAIHGYGGSPENFKDVYLELCDDYNCVLLLSRGTQVMGENSFYWTYTESEMARIKTEIETTIAEHSIDADKVIMTGFSQGGRMCYDFGLSNSHLFCGLIPVSGSFTTDKEIPDEVNEDLKIFPIIGLYDSEILLKSYEGSTEKLASFGIEQKINEFEMGHDYPANSYDVLAEALEWMLN